MDYMDAEELAINVLGLDEETADNDSIEQAIFDKWEVSFEQFHNIAESLEKYTIPAQAGISQKWFRGFVKDGVFLTKTSVEQ